MVPPADLVTAPDVTLTRLPFGGAVLVNRRTLELLECAEPEATVLAALLAGTGVSHEMAPAVARMAKQLLDDGWLVGRSDPEEER
jgi:hypothetical protein